jgi:hypothetical protein
VVHTDGWRSYNALPERGYTRKTTVLSASGDPAHVSMPAVHRVASLLKRWLLGTHQGAVPPEQLKCQRLGSCVASRRELWRYYGLPRGLLSMGGSEASGRPVREQVLARRQSLQWSRQASERTGARSALFNVPES